MKFLYTIITNPLGLPISPIWEYLILLVVGEIVHEIAWNVSPGGTFGSLIYWLTKLLTFVAIWAILYGIISAINFVVANWVWFTIGGAIVLTLSILIIISKKKRATNEQKDIY